MMTEGDESSVTLVQFPPNATLATDAEGNIIDSGASATKSRMTAKALPAGGDNIPLLYARTDATIVSILVVLSGPVGSTVSFDIYSSNNRNAGVSGARLTTTTLTITDRIYGISITLNDMNVLAETFLYAVLTSGAYANFLEFYISYTGGD